MGLQRSIQCAEYAPFTSAEQMLARAKQAFPAYPDAVLRRLPQTTNIFTDCGQWDVPAADPGLVQPVHTDVPTLLVRGLDPITPPSWAAVTARTIPEWHPVGVP
jgi:hypothetical protein